MKKIIAISVCILAVLLLWIVLTSMICDHQWIDADCTTAKTCASCGKTDGTPLGHEWMDADCENPKTCTRCSAVTGPALGHQWIEADCELAKHCTRCDASEGEALGHDWQNADCENPETCANCGKQVGEPVGHLWRESDSRTRKYCRVCYTKAPGSLTLEQAYPAGQLRFADSCFVMDEFDYLEMYEKALNEAGYPYWHEDEPAEEGIPAYEMVDMTTGNVITVSFGFDEDTHKISMIYAYTDFSQLTEDELVTMRDILSISFDVAHGAMTKHMWDRLEDGEYLKTQDEGMYFYPAIVDGLGFASIMEMEDRTFGLLSVADLSSISFFAAAME